MTAEMEKAALSSTFFTDASVSSLAATLHAECFTPSWGEDAFRSALAIPGTVLQILACDETPVAFALYRRMFEEAEILTLGTRPAFRGRRLAATLLREGQTYLAALQVERLFLEVGAQNTPARRLYSSMGFKEIGRRAGYYLHGDRSEDAIIMLKNLH